MGGQFFLPSTVWCAVFPSQIRFAKATICPDSGDGVSILHDQRWRKARPPRDRRWKKKLTPPGVRSALLFRLVPLTHVSNRMCLRVAAGLVCTEVVSLQCARSDARLPRDTTVLDNKPSLRRYVSHPLPLLPVLLVGLTNCF